MSRQHIRIVADDNMPGVEACCANLSGVDFTVVRRPGRDLSAADVAEADWLFVRSITPVNAALLAASRVRFVGTATIGRDHLELPWLAAAGIRVASAPGCNAVSVVQYGLQCASGGGMGFDFIAALRSGAGSGTESATGG